MTSGEAIITGLTRGGHQWVPRFVQAIDTEKCIGCGRCYKVCGRDVLALVEHTDEDDTEKMVMTVAHPELCIGCQACARVCPKQCHSHAPAAAAS